MAYTYLIGWTDLNKYYYGSRSANTVPPADDLWNVYTTSSTYVDAFVAQHGDPDVIRVHKEFSTRREAEEYEEKFLRRVNVLRNPKWLNENISGRPPGGTPAQLAAVKGVAQSEEHKIKRGIYKPKSAETKAKMSKAHSGENNSMYGIKGKDHPQYGSKRTPEQVERIRQGQLNAAAKRKEQGIKITRPPRTEEHKRKLSEAAKARCARKKLTNNDRTSL